jgi:acetyl/propionyl-CoA carboxylase alpha subunit
MTVLVIGRGPTVVTSVVSALHEHAIDAIGVTTDADATAHLTTGGVTALVIGGGVERRSRRRLTRVAEATGATVVHGALRGREVRGYVRDELVPLLRQA